MRARVKCGMPFLRRILAWFLRRSPPRSALVSALAQRCGASGREPSSIFRGLEDLEARETSLESLDEGQEADEEDDIFRLDAPVEDIDEDEEADLLDQEDEED